MSDEISSVPVSSVLNWQEMLDQLNNMTEDELQAAFEAALETMTLEARASYLRYFGPDQ